MIIKKFINLLVLNHLSFCINFFILSIPKKNIIDPKPKANIFKLIIKKILINIMGLKFILMRL